MKNVNRKQTALPVALIPLCVSGLSRAALEQEISAMQIRVVVTTSVLARTLSRPARLMHPSL